MPRLSRNRVCILFVPYGMHGNLVPSSKSVDGLEARKFVKLTRANGFRCVEQLDTQYRKCHSAHIMWTIIPQLIPANGRCKR
jgi:hypothetical protein